MKYLLLKKVIDELAPLIQGAKVSKIYQPSESVLVLKLWNGRDNHKLLISADVAHYRVHLTENEHLNPSVPPRFCQLLRARLSRIDAIVVAEGDRIVSLSGGGKQGPCRLIVELTGRSSNMILLDDRGVVVDCLKRQKPEQGDGVSARRIEAGSPYSAPEYGLSRENCESEQGGVKKASLSWSQYVETLYNESSLVGGRQDLLQQLKKAVQKQLKRVVKRIVNIEAEQLRQHDFEQYRHCGELILANLHLLKRGMKNFTADNYYLRVPAPMEIELDPLMSPQENAEKYFQRYKKYKRGLEHSRRRIDESRVELEWLRQIEYQLEDIVNKSDIEIVADELRAAGLLKERNRLHQRRTQKPSQPLETSSPTGCVILWGKNNQQNDTLSTRNLKGGDLWFHVYGAPGTHVVLKMPVGGQEIAEEDVVYAASIAAGYSKKKNDPKVEVMVAESGAVKKPKKSRPGLVVVRSFKTIMVEPLRFDRLNEK